jgi:hypothetical protein
VSQRRILALGLPAIGTPGSLQPTHVNGYPALVFRVDGEIDTVIALHVAGGLITGLYAVRNPAKLSRMDQETALSR